MIVWTLTTENVAGDNELATSVYTSEEDARSVLRGIFDPDDELSHLTDHQFDAWISDNTDAQAVVERHSVIDLGASK